MTTERIDVLAVMDEFALYVRNVSSRHALRGDIAEARAAVAELVEAVEAHNEASDELAASYGPDADRALREKIAARARLDAALRPLTGEQA